MTLAMAVSIAASVPRILMVRMLSLLTRPSRTFAAGVGLVDQSVLLLVMGAKKRFTTLIESDFGDIRRSGWPPQSRPPSSDAIAAGEFLEYRIECRKAEAHVQNLRDIFIIQGQHELTSKA